MLKENSGLVFLDLSKLSTEKLTKYEIGCLYDITIAGIEMLVGALIHNTSLKEIGLRKVYLSNISI